MFHAPCTAVLSLFVCLVDTLVSHLVRTLVRAATVLYCNLGYEEGFDTLDEPHGRYRTIVNENT